MQFDDLYKIINEKENIFNKFFNDLNNSGFLNYAKREEIINEYEELYETTSKLIDSSKELPNEFDKIVKFNKVYSDLINYNNVSDSEPNSIKDLNLKALDDEISQNEDFFNGITDENKRRAIVIDDKNVRVNAGAGTGKTFTIQKKVQYLVEKKNIPVDKILCLSYTVKGAEDLNEKVNDNLPDDKEVKAVTFHEFCRNVAWDCGYHNTTDRDILEKAINNYFKRILNSRKLDKLIEYFGYYINSPIDNEEYDSYEELLAYENGKDLKSLKKKFYDSKISTFTMQGEIVKSIGELIIANYLFMHEIEYVYETNYKSNLLDIIKNHFIHSGNYFSLVNLSQKDEWIDKFIEKCGDWYLYRPDFYLPEYGIYLEHFGIKGTDEDEKWLGKDYLNQMERKRKFHKENQTILLETYYSYLYEGRLVEELEELLESNGVTIGQMNRKDIFEILKDANKIDDYDNFKDLIMNFINIFEAQNSLKSRLNQFKKANKLEKDGYKRKRQELFLDIVGDIYNEYYKLNDGKKIDNNREVSLALELIQTKKYSKDFDYILIDEYQDINPIRSLLLQSLQKNTGAKLFVVGDDWQSIYRFNGSDLKLFLDFNNYFPNSELVQLKENRRNFDAINDVASKFIMENEYQEKKELDSINKWENEVHPIKIIRYSPRPDSKKVLRLYSIISEVIKNNPKKDKAEILLLGRNNSDIEEFTNNSIFRVDNRMDRVKVICSEFPQADITFMSIHKSKGLEYDDVIILNFKDYFSGFPNKIEDDSVLSFLKDREECQYAEERRLLYVALTRTLNNVYLLAPKYDKSIFIKELIKNYGLKPIEMEVDEKIEENFEFLKSEEQIDKVNELLNNASYLKSRKKCKSALEIFEKCYKFHRDCFKYSHKEDFAWSFYNIRVKRLRKKEELFKSVHFIINLVEQKNLKNYDLSCVYTTAVFDVLKYLKDRKQFDEMFYWFDKIDPELLNIFPDFKKGNKSKKELYYDYLSNAYYGTCQYEKCVGISSELDKLGTIVDDSWTRWRIGKSLDELGRYSESLEYLKYAAKKLKIWHICRDIVQSYLNHFKSYPYSEVLDFLCIAVLSSSSNEEKMSIFYLCYRVFKDNNHNEMAIIHMQFYYLLLDEKGYSKPEFIKNLGIEETTLCKDDLENSIMEIWGKYRKFRANSKN